jgi:hypothetical protein
MASMPVTFSTGTRLGKKTIRVEFDADRFEDLARLFGMYHPEFLETVDKSEADFKAGRYAVVKSLSELDIPAYAPSRRHGNVRKATKGSSGIRAKAAR